MPDQFTHTPLSRQLVEDGLRPRARISAAPSLRQLFFDAAMEALTAGAPALKKVSREVLAGSIAMKCERAAELFGAGA